MNKLEKLIAKFIFNFENVFDYDWQHTKDCLDDKNLISDNGTFIRHMTKGPNANWVNRGHLMDSYKELKSQLMDNDIYFEDLIMEDESMDVTIKPIKPERNTDDK